MNGLNIFGRTVAGLVLIAAVAGIAFFTFNAGVAQGVATNLPQSATQPGTMPYQYFGAPFFWHPFGVFGGIFGLLIGLFLLFFVFRLISFIVWGPRWGWGHRHMWRHGWSEEGVHPMFEEMHKRSHENWHEEKRHPRADGPAEKKE